MVSSLFSAAESTVPGETTSQQATDQLRESFEFPRRTLKESDLERLGVPSRVLEATSEHPAVVFTSARGTSEVCNSYPAVLISSGEQWSIAEMLSTGWSWADVWTSADRSQIWAALTFHCESPNGEVVLLHSPDGGWTWRTLSSINFGYYQDGYETFRLAPDGQATVVGSWYREDSGAPCPIASPSDKDGTHGECHGLMYFHSTDAGATWVGSKAFHGSYRQLQQRSESDVHRLADSEYLKLDELELRFGTAPMRLDSDRLPEAQSLPFDRKLLERATSVSRYSRPFLEIPIGDSARNTFPYVLDSGSRDERDAQLIKLPYPGFQWSALGTFYTVGILQSLDNKDKATWVVHCVNPEREWTAGKLPDLPREPSQFDSLVEVENGALEFHIRRLPEKEHPEKFGRDIYQSKDGGRTWTLSRFEPDTLLPVEPEEYLWVSSREDWDNALAVVMENAVANLVESNDQRPALPRNDPNVKELTELLRVLDWHMPKLGVALWNAYDDEALGQPALHFAVTYKGDSVALLKSLLEAGADIHTRTKGGLSALDYAVRENAQEAIDFLRARETDLGGANERGVTSLHWLARTSFHVDIDWDWKGTKDEIAQRALAHAAFLLDHGADPNAEDDRGRTPIQDAVDRKSSFALAQLLIEHGAEVHPTKEVDVIVYGATPGGFCAAIAAAREGASVILLEPTGHVGGVNTGGLSFSDSNQTVRSTVMGLFDEWHRRIQADYVARGVELPYDVAVKDQAKWTYEPHVAMQITMQMLDEAKVQVRTEEVLQSVTKNGPKITALLTNKGSYTAKTYVDTTYEGDLMAAAGVGWTIGREGRAEYGESLAGKRFPKRKMEISGLDDDGEPLPLMTTTDAGPEAEGDERVMVYSFRLCLTDDPDNRVPFPEPEHYDPARFEAVRRYAQSGGKNFGWDSYPLPGNKFDGNNSIGGNFSLGLVGACNGWSEADAEGRKKIWEAHKQYTLEFRHFLVNDPAVPEAIREQYINLGLCKDEFAEYDHFSPQLYVREGRRMKGQYVVTEKDILESPEKEDPIVVSSFPIDSHDVQRVALPEGGVINEGTIFPVRMEGRRHGYPYHIPYRAILPQSEECSNLLVPVALSCTHVAISSIRVEPTWMILGQSAGIAAALAAKTDVTVQDVPYPTLRERLLAQGQVLDLPELPPLPPKPEKLGAVDPKTLPGIVLDDSDAELTGTWKHSTNFPVYVGTGYVHDDSAGDRKATATFRFTVPADGNYELRMAYSAHPTRATKVPAEIVCGETKTTIFVDQTQPLPQGKHFRKVGTVALRRDSETTITLGNSGTNGFVIVDALQLIPLPE